MSSEILLRSCCMNSSRRMERPPTLTRRPISSKPRADISLVTLASFDFDPYPFLAAVTGDDRSFGDTVPNGWMPPSLRRPRRSRSSTWSSAQSMALALVFITFVNAEGTVPEQWMTPPVAGPTVPDRDAPLRQ